MGAARRLFLPSSTGACTLLLEDGLMARRLHLLVLATAIAVIVGFVGTGTARAQTVDPGGGLTDTEKALRDKKAGVIHNWLANVPGIHIRLIPGGAKPHYHIDFTDPTTGKELTAREICCKIELLMRALRKVIATPGPNGTVIDHGEDDRVHRLPVNLPNGLGVVNVILLLGDGDGDPLATGGEGDIVIVGGKDRPGKSDKTGQSATAATGQGGIAISAPGKGADNDAGNAGNGGAGKSDAGADGQAVACGGQGGRGLTGANNAGQNGGNGGPADATVAEDKDTKSAGPEASASAHGGDGNKGGDGKNGPDSGKGGKGAQGTATIKGTDGSNCKADGGDGANGGTGTNGSQGGPGGGGGNGVANAKDAKRDANGGGGGAHGGPDHPAPPGQIPVWPNAPGGQGILGGGPDRGEPTDHKAPGMFPHVPCDITDAMIDALIPN